MARDREIQCRSYICEGQCSKGREGTFRKACQVCNKYVPLRGAAPARTDNRAHKLNKINKREMRREEY